MRESYQPQSHGKLYYACPLSKVNDDMGTTLSTGPSTPLSSFPGPSTPLSYSPGPSRFVPSIGTTECSNYKFLSDKIKFDVTDDDIKELNGVFELGFGLDMKNELNPKLKRAFPALEMYVAMNGQFKSGEMSRPSSLTFDSLSNTKFIIDPSVPLTAFGEVVISAGHL
nr:hypothetical protein [Tanacetum cinerariifolium]